MPQSIPMIMPTPDTAPPEPNISIPVVPTSPTPQTQSQTVTRRNMARREIIKWGLVLGVGTVTVATIIDLAVHAGAGQIVNSPTPTQNTPGSTPLFGTLIYSYSPNVFTLHAVFAVAWSPNGQYIASGSYDNTVQVWDSAKGGIKYRYIGHTKPVEVLAWSPDGTRIASGGDDTTVQVWDALTGANVRTFKLHSNSVWGLAWSPDGKYIASGSFDSTVKVWWAI